MPTDNQPIEITDSQKESLVRILEISVSANDEHFQRVSFTLRSSECQLQQLVDIIRSLGVTDEEMTFRTKVLLARSVSDIDAEIL